MDFVIKHWNDLILIVTGLISVASIIVRLSPSEVDNKILAKIIEVAKVIGLYK